MSHILTCIFSAFRIFVKFQMSKIRTEGDEWREIMWYCWGLADPPEDWDVTATDGKKIDEKTWKL